MHAMPTLRLIASLLILAIAAQPLVEVETAQGRVAYGSVTAADVGGLFSADFLGGAAHALRLGPTEEIPYLKTQQRLTFERAAARSDQRSVF